MQPSYIEDVVTNFMVLVTLSFMKLSRYKNYLSLESVHVDFFLLVDTAIAKAK